MPRRSGRQANEPLEQLDMAGEKTDTGERVRLVDSAEPAAAEEPAAKAPSLKARLAAIRDECDAISKDNIQKEKDGKKWTERGHTVEVVLSEFRPLLAKHGVEMTPNLVERTYNGNRCDVIVDWEFERTDDSDEKRVIRWGGADTDNGGKAFAKAGTNALKEMIKKKFLVTDRDDAKEETESVEHDTGEGASRRDVENLKEDKRALQEKWAKTLRAAIASAPTEAALKLIELDNKAQLMDATLSEVTRSFFIDLLVRRKADLKADAAHQDLIP